MDFDSIDLTKLSEADLIGLNRRIVERLQLLRSADSLVQLARFLVGMIVEFETDDGRTISGTVARLNQRTATVVTAAGRWRVSPSLWRAAAGPQGTGMRSARVCGLRRQQKSRSFSASTEAVGAGFSLLVFGSRCSPQFRTR